ncbi:MAG: iron chaperone [Gemmatimonadaceae bacterium]
MTVDEYLNAVPQDQRAALSQLRQTIRGAAPNADETVSYRIPFYKYNGMLVGFSAAKEHCTFHIISADVLRDNAAALKKFETGKGSIRFTPENPLPKALVTKIVKARIAENQRRAQKKRR